MTTKTPGSRSAPPATEPLALKSNEGLGAVSEARCMCKDRALSACPGEWEPGCDLGNNPAHVRVVLASEQRPPDGGPRFRIGVEGRHIIDEDFIFDAMLKVDGDFDDATRTAYAQWICDALNEADKKLPREPRAPNVRANLRAEGPSS